MAMELRQGRDPRELPFIREDFAEKVSLGRGFQDQAGFLLVARDAAGDFKSG